MARDSEPFNMKSRRAILKTAGAAAVAMAAGPLSKIFAGAADNLNIILIVADALRADRLGCYGYRRTLPNGAPGSTTPVIDRMAREGILYENCISQSSWTQTAMASLLYSAWPVLKGNSHSFAFVPHHLKAPEAASPSLERLAFQSNPFMREPLFMRIWDYHKYIHGQDYAPAQVVTAEADWGLSDVIRDGKSFFAYIHYMEPHEPYSHKHRFRGVYKPDDWTYFHPLALCNRVSKYHDDTGRMIAEIPSKHRRTIQGMGEVFDEDVMHLDSQLAKLFKILEGYGIMGKTVIIFTADHGQSFCDHGWCGHKQTLYQEEIHVPLIIKGPGLPVATRVRAQVRSVDILPTIAAISGVSAPGMVGAPLLPVHRVEAGGNREAYSCCDYAKYGKVFRLLTCLVNDRRLKYIRILTKERQLLREELFDLAADPHEQHDLASSRAEDVKALSARMDAFERNAYWSGAVLKTQGLDEETKSQLRSLGYLQ